MGQSSGLTLPSCATEPGRLAPALNPPRNNTKAHTCFFFPESSVPGQCALANEEEAGLSHVPPDLICCVRLQLRKSHVLRHSAANLSVYIFDSSFHPSIQPPLRLILSGRETCKNQQGKCPETVNLATICPGTPLRQKPMSPGKVTEDTDSTTHIQTQLLTATKTLFRIAKSGLPFSTACH